MLGQFKLSSVKIMTEAISRVQ